MQVATSTVSKLLLGLTVAFALGTHAEAQERAGVVTTLEGAVTVMRTSLPEPAPLKFKDDIFVMDRITTAKDSVVRILLGGKAVVTVREHSVVTITEMPGRSTIDVVAGRAAVAVAREKMRAGDFVEVKTPNAVAGIRGTVIVAEVVDAERSVITVLKGVIDVTRLDGGRRVGHPTVVKALERVIVAGGDPVSAPQRIAPGNAKDLGQEFRVAPPRSTPSAVTAALKGTEVDRAARHLARLSGLRKADRHDTEETLDDDDRMPRRGADGNADKVSQLRKAQGLGQPADARTAVSPNGLAAITSVGEALKNGVGETLTHGNRGNGKHKGW